MIQRIQTVYLLAVLSLSSTMFFADFISFATEADVYVFNFLGVFSESQAASTSLVNSLALSILIVFPPLISLLSIFLYKKRVLQIRLCAINMGLLIGVSGLIFYFGRTFAKELGATVAYGYPVVLPLIALVFSFLALRAIGKDEALIKSMDRIR